MHHPFDGLNTCSPEALPTRRTMLGAMVAAAAGAVGVAHAEAKSTKAVGEEGGASTKGGPEEEGGYRYYAPPPRPQPLELKPEQMQTAWADLADPAKSYLGVQQLVSATKAVPFLKERLRLADPPKPGQIEKLVEELDDTTFATRQKATETLEKLGMAADSALRKVLDGKPPLEVRRRIENILATFARQRTQMLYGLTVLTLHGTHDALTLLISLSEGPKDAVLTSDAQGAIANMSQFCWTSWSQAFAPKHMSEDERLKLKLRELEQKVREQQLKEAEEQKRRQLEAEEQKRKQLEAQKK